MAGRPISRARFSVIKERGGWKAILDRYAAGESIPALARDYDVTRQWLNTELLKPARREAYLAAKKAKAAALVELSQDIAEGTPADRDAIQRAKLIIEQYQWQATKLDREQFGETPPAGVTLNIENLSLDALRWREVAPVRAVAEIGERSVGEGDTQLATVTRPQDVSK